MHIKLASGVRVSQRTATARCDRKNVVLYDMHDRHVPYEKVWAWQRERASQVASGLKPQACLLLQHESVYTLGTMSTLTNLKFDPNDPPFPVHRTERGGEVTYHGPGQLVLYPIIDLKQQGQDLHLYLRMLEAVVIDCLYNVSGIEAFRVEGLTGVWVSTGKIAATGIRATRWISYHGIALNVCNDLGPFGHIIPCGLENKPVASAESHLKQYGIPVPGGDVLLEAFSTEIMTSFQKVFGLQISRVQHDID